LADASLDFLHTNHEIPTQYPITLNVAVFEETAKLLISYQKSFLAPKYAVAIGQAFAHVMSQVLSQPHQAIREIELLNHEQRAEIEIRNALVPEAVTTLVHHTIQQRCLEQPSAQAVCAWDGDFTFNELNQLSSNLAEELVDHGVGVESPIALYLEKSRWTPVAILGVLKAGATFVLLDASHPSARLQTICEDSQSSLVLASSSLLSKATDLSSCVIEIGDRLLTYRTLTVRSQTVEVSSNNAAYIVFTSGSTGKPKGIVVDHSSLSTSLQSLLSRCDITSTTRLLQFASHAFDIAVLDLLLALIAGGCVCIPSDAERTSDITCAMNRMRVTCAVTTPTVARMFDLDELPHFKALCLGGESVSTADLMMWHNKVRTISLYGPAECTLACTAGEPMTMASNPRNIGFGSGCVPWIVDRSDYRRLVPDGVVGELLLEGPIVARGYLNNPPQTSVSFVKPPSWLAALRAGGPPPRLYKTGDMVRYAEDGSLIFVGRTDDQVKIRGQRLELGEVEVQVSSAFSEDHVLVELVNRSGFPVLVAFVLQSHLEEAPRGSYGSLLHPPSKAFYDSIRSGISHLKMTMPSYMIPSAFLPLATLPKGSTGKTDRRRLREHAASLSEVELEAYIIAGMSRRAPSTPLETRLQELVARSLNKPTANIPLDEDVFQIGMDSMKAMQLVAAGRRDGVRFSVQMLFQYPRLSDLAAALKQKTDIDRTPVKPSPLLEFADEICAEWCLDPSEVVNIAPATYYQRDMIKIHHLAHISIHFSRPIDQARLQSAFVATIERHPVLRTIFVPFQQTFVQVVLRHVDLAVEDISTDEDPKDALQSICRADAESPPPFGKPTLFLFVVTGRGRQSISLRMNHAHYDGMTIYLMMQEVAARYADSKSVFPYSLTHPDFVAHRVQRITPATHQFWRDLLQDSSMTYLDENDNGMGRPDRMRLDLLASCSGDMPMPDLQDGITIATAIKAAWSLCLAQYSNSNDVVFAQVSTNRALDIEGIDRMLGPGVNYIAVRVTLQPDWTAKELFRWVQDQHIRAMSYDTVDWDDMVAQSTSWPKDTPIGTGVHYINAPPLWNHDYLFNDEVPARNEHIDFKALHSYPMLLCVPLPATDNGPPRLGISLSSLTFSQDVAEKLFSLFRETVVRLTTYPEDLVCPV
jgi:amino acid adenylation domain-containing protein